MVRHFMWSQNEHTTYVSALLGNRADMALIIIIFVVVGLESGYNHAGLHWEIPTLCFIYTLMNLVNHVWCTANIDLYMV